MDEETSNVHGMGGGIGGVNGVGGSGHTNGVYSLVWGDGGCAMGLDTFISGGWDKNVFFWDTRAGTAKPVRAIYGPFLGGDALDIDDYLVRIYLSIILVVVVVVVLMVVVVVVLMVVVVW